MIMMNFLLNIQQQPFQSIVALRAIHSRLVSSSNTSKFLGRICETDPLFCMKKP